MAYSYEKDAEKILHKLLEHHSADTLIGMIRKEVAMINRKGRKKLKKRNDYLNISISIYQLVYRSDYKLVEAIEYMAEEIKISKNTIRNHMNKFRKLFGSSDKSKEQVSELIKQFILTKHKPKDDGLYYLPSEEEIKEFVKDLTK